ncbi:3-phenylpropionate/trans-cinnamate dioxygenase ferredoxin subunit [Nakamurella sp. UYEF19]|uniref:bifunctional 3-phenylpropionate/cinnamic acid dioxygenase ferredoxin subunit n=1 Tax=Nakamurella sp. UYEF19 TaxID=1756392 RepID=UPI0033945A20
MTAETAQIVDVCGIDDLPDGESAIVTIDEVGRIAVFFTQGEYFGIQDRCSHQQAWLSDGFIEGCAVECPLHASTFDLRTGRPDGPPAKVAVPVFRAFAQDGRVKLVTQAL